RFASPPTHTTPHLSATLVVRRHYHCSSAGSCCHSLLLPVTCSQKLPATTQPGPAKAHLHAAESAACACRSSRRRPTALAHQLPSRCPASPNHSTRTRNRPRD